MLSQNVISRPTPVRAIRVMVVDDSVVMRGMISRTIGAAGSDLEVVASASNGQFAVERCRKRDVDVVVLDVEMPVMDGLTALPLLLAVDPDLVIIMASSLTTRNADISLKALSIGAKDYVPKPSSLGTGSDLSEFQRELVSKIRALAVRVRLREVLPATQANIAETAESAGYKLRPVARSRPRVLAIGSSTGGPHALTQVLKGLPRPVRIPILITQHMPATFTPLLAQNLSRETGIECAEGKEGEPVVPGKAYLAPGDFHMLVTSAGTRQLIQLSQLAKEHFCRPAVDPMLRALLKVYHRNILVAIVTGMGTDGLAGSTAIADAGGNVVAQDEGSSVVWGMPGAVAKAGICCDVVSLDRLGARLGELIGG
jgi:two-component system chemotaxis response regulator CheB